MVGDDSGRRRASNTLNMSEGQATRRMTKSLKRVKHERGGTVGDKETNQIYMRWRLRQRGLTVRYIIPLLYMQQWCLSFILYE